MIGDNLKPNVLELLRALNEFNNSDTVSWKGGTGKNNPHKEWQ